MFGWRFKQVSPNILEETGDERKEVEQTSFSSVVSVSWFAKDESGACHCMEELRAPAFVP